MKLDDGMNITSAASISHLIDGKYSIKELVDIDRLRTMFEAFSKATGFTTGFVSYPGQEVLIGTGWRDICTKFHRQCPVSSDLCKESNIALTARLKDLKELNIQPCGNGLVDGATPVVIRGKHLASLATGQVLLAPPDIKRFREHAKQCGFEVDQYLEALAQVPVVTEEQLKGVLSFLSGLAVQIAEEGLARLELQESAEALQKENTERKRVEESLRIVSEAINSAVGPFAMADLDGKMTYANLAAVRLWGYADTDQVLGKSVSLFWDDPEDVCQIMAQLKRGEEVIAERVARKKDGALFDVLFAVNQVKDASGNPIGLMMSAIDISEHKRAEETLKQSESRYRKLFENMLEGFAYCRMIFEDNQPSDWIYLSVNEAFERLTGLKDVVGKRITEIIPGIRTIHPETFEIYGRVASTGKPETFEHYFEPLGIWLSVSVHGAEKGHFVVVFENITERKLAMEALRESEERYRSVVANIGIGITLLSPKMEVLEINPQVRAWNPGVDISKRPVCYRTFNQPARSCICPECPTAKTLEDGLVHEAVVETLRGTETRNHRIISSPIKNRDGEVVAAIEMIEDITERMRLEKEILKISEFEKQRLGQDLHDDICQALIGTSLQTNTIASRLDLASHPETDNVREISKQINQLATNVRNLARTLFPAHLLAEGFTDALDALASHVEKSFRIPCSFECGAAPAINDENIASHLFRIAQEALHNAAKHSRGTNLALRLDSDGSTISVTVTDNGIGFDHTSKEHEGMGMRTMQYRANQVGATLAVSSNPGIGTTVTCSLPLPDNNLKSLPIARGNSLELKDFSRLQQIGLTPRQCEVLYWLSQGKRDAEIATILSISLRTINHHVADILDRFDVETRTTAVIRAIETLIGDQGKSETAR